MTKQAGPQPTLEFLGPSLWPLAASRRWVDLRMRARRWGGLRCLSSAVPFLADLLALRRVPARFSGVFVIANTVSVVIAGRRGH